ncbi:MAG: HD domain-containing protein [Erysipelotrichaceae bacterium]|nr:HD domain-containing protein [Erysipelotrichaceae bacterium]
MKIRDFMPQTRISQPLLVYQIKEGVTNSGSPYLTVTFRDNSGQIDGKLWSVTPEQKEMIKAGEVMNVTADIITYQNAPQMKIVQIEPIDQKLVDLSEFVTTGPIPADQLREGLEGYVSSIKDMTLRLIVKELYDRLGDDIYRYPAAARNHHEYVSGLATHIYSMARLAEFVTGQYPVIDRDLLMAGVLVHDLGKITELRMSSVTEYTLEGNLLGHISITQSMISDAAEKVIEDYPLDSEKVTLLRHLVLSHHGKYEFGSPVLPKTVEAVALNAIDDLDAKLTMLDRELNSTRSGSYTLRLPAFENRAFYKHKGNEKDE